MSIQQNGRSVLHNETAKLLDDAFGLDGMKGLPSWLYTEASKQRNGHKTTCLEQLLVMIEHGFSLDGAIAVGNRVKEAVEARQCDHAICVLTAQIEEQESDGEEDVAGAFAMQDPSKRRLHLDRLERHRVKIDRLIRAYRKEIREEAEQNGRKPIRQTYGSRPRTQMQEVGNG